jgi:hypothetical protein
MAGGGAIERFDVHFAKEGAKNRKREIIGKEQTSSHVCIFKKTLGFENLSSSHLLNLLGPQPL